ncbi:MAG: cytosolic Fe-S cluster assembly factor nbp35 [Watsoniomyces obsoletus]|nr:MAG: cytosolic Fe-S cluster assembly factor nbp35 [Watsoniomyces obsoletus]
MATAVALPPISTTTSPSSIVDSPVQERQPSIGKVSMVSKSSVELASLAAERPEVGEPSTGGSSGQGPPRRDRPCDSCRRRKTRCVMLNDGPVCSSCRMHKQACTFVENPLPRKRRAQSEGPDSALKRRSSLVATKDYAVSPSGLPESSRANENRNARMRNPSEPASVITRRSVSYVGYTTEIESSLSKMCRIRGDPDGFTAQRNLHRLGEDAFIVPAEPDVQSAFQHATRAYRTAIEGIVGPFGSVLIELYWNHVHPGFPILDRPTFLDQLRQASSTIPPPLLAAIYLLGLRWWTSDPRVQSRPEPDRALLESLAYRSFEWALRRPELSTVQAGLLLLQHSDGESWAVTGRLTAVAQDLGLHLDPSGWNIPRWERGLRKRVAWALFMQDKWGALVHGRPTHLMAANWAVGTLTEEDFEEEDDDHDNNDDEASEAEPTSLLFRQMVTLTIILSEVLDTFYTLQALHEIGLAGKDGTRLVLDRAKPIQIKLKDWFSRLPGCLRMDRGRKFSSLGSLHLAYFATEITLHRRIVHSLDINNTDPYLVHICRSAAKTRLISAMDFVNRLKIEQLQAFWYSASKVNFALVGTFGSLLLASSPSEQEAEFYRLRLSEYRWTLTVSAKWARFIQFALSTLEASMEMLRNMEEKPSLASFPAFDLVLQDERKRAAAAAASAAAAAGGIGGGEGGKESMMDPPLGLASPSISLSSGTEESGGSPGRQLTPGVHLSGSEDEDEEGEGEGEGGLMDGESDGED